MMARANQRAVRTVRGTEINVQSSSHQSTARLTGLGTLYNSRQVNMRLRRSR